ncbi:MAG: amino acid permease [Gammaproteobacteria bacterium]|nr:amino acid permease [Gammaproteobacteria bacterium]
MSKKIGFWSIFAIVIGSQIGSGIFMLPVALTPFGVYSILGWVVSGAGAVCLALVFAGLCGRLPKTGGPHVYIKETFGASAAFFTGWTYWVISWFSTTAVVIASIGYLSPFIGNQSSTVYLLLEIALLIVITWINLKGVKIAGKAGIVLTLLKIIPLLILPIAAFWYFDAQHFVTQPAIETLPLSSKLAQVTMLTLWGFIGLEIATTSAGSVNNPSKTIPRAIIFGTMFTAIVYLINSLGIMGLLPQNVLSVSKAPYTDASQYLFGGQWHLVISLIASIICIGTLNAWMLASGQIALGLAEDRLLPGHFSKKNTHDAPRYGLIISCIGILPFLILTADHSIAQQVTSIIDYSVTAFLFVYGFCTLAYIKILWQEKAKLYHWIYALIALIFCIWVIKETSIFIIATASIFVLSGIPLYFIWYKRKKI